MTDEAQRTLACASADTPPPAFVAKQALATRSRRIQGVGRTLAADEVAVAADLLERLYIAVGLPAIPAPLWHDLCGWIGARSITCEPAPSLGERFRFDCPEAPVGNAPNVVARVVSGGEWLRVEVAPSGEAQTGGIAKERLNHLVRHLLVALSLRRRIHSAPDALPALPVDSRDVEPRIIQEHLARSLGITRSEAKLAIGLAAGHTVTSYCATIGIKTGTARCHLKSINRKVGTHNQLSLVRLVLATLNGLPARATTANSPLAARTSGPT